MRGFVCVCNIQVIHIRQALVTCVCVPKLILTSKYEECYAGINTSVLVILYAGGREEGREGVRCGM